MLSIPLLYWIIGSATIMVLAVVLIWLGIREVEKDENSRKNLRK